MNQTPSISFPASTAAPAPLHDIVGPLPFFPYTTGEVLIALSVFFVLLGGLLWSIRKFRQKPPLTPSEVALKALAKMKEQLMEGSDHDFGILVSTLLRDYLGTVFLLAAPRQTTEEFLASLRDHNRFTASEQESLRTFLNYSDLLKFAHGQATEDDRLSLITSAEQFVQGGNYQHAVGS